jgi:beta-lactamase regulating signal transducer with metallopeptidase domain
MSLTASYVIIFVMLVRIPLKKAPKVISYALWGVVAFRLLCPFSFESMFSLLPTNAAPIPYNIAYEQSPQINSGIAIVDTFVNSVLPSPSIGASINPLQVYTWIGSYIWILGIILMLVYSIVSVLILKRHLKNAKQTEKNIYEANNLKTPFVLGIFRPRIYVPTGLTAEEKSFIILHEQTHIRRFDHIVKPFAFLVLSIHWFNPMVWIAFLLMSSDMELSCDEKVIKEMGGEIKKAYSTSLLSLATGRPILNGSPLAFGEGNVKGRIKNVLNYRKPSSWIIVAAVIAVVVVSIGLLVNPKNNKFTLNGETLSFKSTETNLIKLGTIAFDEYMSSLISEKMPVNERITSYKLKKISLLAGDINEFCVSLNYDFTTDNDSYVNPSVGAKGKGTWPDNYMEIRVKKVGKGAYEIVSIGTGGGGQGLSPVGDNTFNPEKAISMVIKGRWGAISEGQNYL